LHLRADIGQHVAFAECLGQERIACRQLHRRQLRERHHEGVGNGAFRR
jgi:hypothetical protein